MTEYAATLPHPPGINATYRSGRGHWYKSPRARQWEQDALPLLRSAGFCPLPPGDYHLAVSLDLYTIRLDADAPIKLAIDCIASALGIDDRHVAHLDVDRHRVHKRADERLHVRVVVTETPVLEPKTAPDYGPKRPAVPTGDTI